MCESREKGQIFGNARGWVRKQEREGREQTGKSQVVVLCERRVVTTSRGSESGVLSSFGVLSCETAVTDLGALLCFGLVYYCGLWSGYMVLQSVRLLVNDRKFPAGNSVFLSHQTSQQ